MRPFIYISPNIPPVNMSVLSYDDWWCMSGIVIQNFQVQCQSLEKIMTK
ncbi:hypothetical protein ACQKII_18050 [Lysinibacillus sp. NPDC048646]